MTKALQNLSQIPCMLDDYQQFNPEGTERGVFEAFN